MKNEASIRIATNDDLDTIQSLNKLLFDYESQFGNTYNPEWTYSEIGKKCFYDRINQEKGIVLVAELRTRVIGYICGLVNTHPYRSINPICELENMFVLEEHRRQGVGKNLVESFIKEAKKKSAKRISVGALFQNTKAINFYKKLGLSEFELYLEKDI